MLSMLFKNRLYVHVSQTIYYLAICAACFGLTACHIYRSDLRQGIHLKPEQLAKLEPGLTKQQVQKILGTPALAPVSPERLDYYYSFSPNQDGITEQQHITLYFNNNDKLNHYEGDIKLDKLPTTSKDLQQQSKKP